MQPMAKCIMIQGTGSDVGKSIITAGLCRIFKEDGYSVAPFKSQNMSLNSFVTPEGHEIARAQALQASAAGIEPHVHMNPVLLKPNTAIGSQVVLQGKVHGNMSSGDYQLFKRELRSKVLESYQALAGQHDIIVIEGAGSCAEINLRENDIANMGLAQMVDAPVLLAGDIDRGGIFAAFVGSMELLSPEDKRRIHGFIINKFRGELEILKPGLAFLEEKTGRPVLGILPYLKELNLPEEDSLDFRAKTSLKQGQRNTNIKVGVVQLPHLSNFTDFDPLKHEPNVHLSYIAPEAELEGFDLVVLPGTKNTLGDLLFLENKGFKDRLKRYLDCGGRVLGICGGFQMLGERISDPYSIESKENEVAGFGLIKMQTILEREKTTRRVKGHNILFNEPVSGYEIHMGQTAFEELQNPFVHLEGYVDGHVSADGKIMGTYIHGILDEDDFRRSFLSSLKQDFDRDDFFSFNAMIERSFRELSATMRQHLDIEKIYRIISI